MKSIACLIARVALSGCIVGVTSLSPSHAAFPRQAEASCAHNRTITRVSVMGDGTEHAGEGTYFMSYMLSADGTVAAFDTPAALLPEDSNGVADVYVYDLTINELGLVSVASDGTTADGGDSRLQDISSDGQYIAFTSVANNLVPDDMTGQDVFVHDRQTGETVIVSVATGGNVVGGAPITAAISGDGQVIAFVAIGAEFVEGDTNGVEDVFIHNRTTGETTRVSVGAEGAEGDAKANFARLSADGQIVAFSTNATNLVAGETWNSGGIFVLDRATGESQLVTNFPAAKVNPTYLYDVTPDGQGVIFGSFGDATSDDSNQVFDVYRFDRATGELILLPSPRDIAPNLSPYTVSDVSSNGEQVVFSAGDTQTGLSDDNNGFYDALLFDSTTMTLVPLSVSANGEWANYHVDHVNIAGNGCAAIFITSASNLVEGDTNGAEDIFVVRFTE